MGFPVKPECPNLTPLEERLISPCIPFIQIRKPPRGRQLSNHGNVVNVPADVNSVIHTLSRPVKKHNKNKNKSLNLSVNVFSAGH